MDVGNTNHWVGEITAALSALCSSIERFPDLTGGFYYKLSES